MHHHGWILIQCVVIVEAHGPLLQRPLARGRCRGRERVVLDDRQADCRHRLVDVVLAVLAELMLVDLDVHLAHDRTAHGAASVAERLQLVRGRSGPGVERHADDEDGERSAMSWHSMLVFANVK